MVDIADVQLPEVVWRVEIVDVRNPQLVLALQRLHDVRPHHPVPTKDQHFHEEDLRRGA